MKLVLKRAVFDDTGTPGDWSTDGEFICKTLEPPRGAASPCIPAGTYVLELRKLGTSDHDAEATARMGKDDDGNPIHVGMIQLVDVPGRTGVEVHWGNSAADTLACILVGMSSAKILIPGKTQIGYWLNMSFIAYRTLYLRVSHAIATANPGDPVRLTIIDPPGVPVA